MKRLLLLLPLLVAPLSACRNSCQQICPIMAAYAEDCGFEVSNEEVSACIAAQSGSSSREDRAVCREAGSRGDVRDEWTCDDLSDYWARQAPVDTGAADSAP